MKSIMKLSLVITPLLCTALQAAERSTTGEGYWDKRIEEVATKINNLDPQDPEAFRKLQREMNNQAAKKMKEEFGPIFVTLRNQQEMKEEFTTALTHQQNHNLQQQLHNQESK